MQVTLVIHGTPQVDRATYADDWPVVVRADGLTMLLSREHAGQLAEALSQLVQALQDEESEGPLPEYFPVRA